MAVWSKDQQVRINETFDYIASRVPGGERKVVKDFLKNWLTGTYGGAVGQRLFSESLSTRHDKHVGNKETRAARRALVILRGDMLNGTNPLKMQAAQIMAMPSALVSTSLNSLLPAFRLYAQQEERVNTALQIKLNSFKSNPQTFMQANLVVMQSAPSATGTGGAMAYRFLYHYADQVYLLVPAASARPNGVRGDGIVLQVVNVPEMFWFNVPGRGNTPAAGSFAQLPCTELTGADLMVTSAFTGCSFCFKNNGGHVYAAHISPDGTAANAGPSIGAAPALATQLVATGDFTAPPGAVAGALSVFGRGHSNLPAVPNGYTVNVIPGTPLVAASMYIIGTESGGIWRLVYQENNGGVRTVGRLL